MKTKQGKTVMYLIKRGNKYLQGIEANEDYAIGACAPTMGVRHSYSEYKSVWGDEKREIEFISAANYLKAVFQEYRWNELKAKEIKIIPIERD